MLSKLTIGIIVIVMSFFAFKTPKYPSKENLLNTQEKSSISFSGGKYRIDSSVIHNDQNKRMLLSSVQTQSLIVKKTLEEIPGFIMDFLNSNAYGKKFEMVNPGEEWKCGIADFGHTIVTKYCDPVTKDTIIAISGDGAILPNKQFCYFGIGKDVALFTYYTSAFDNPVQNVVMIKFQNEKILDFWYRGYNYRYGNPKGDYRNGNPDTLKITTKTEIIKTLNSKAVGGC